MTDQSPTKTLVIRIATPEDIVHIDHLDSFSASPTRHIHREMHKYFGSVDPSTHELTIIFLVEVEGEVVGKAELMIPPQDAVEAIGYVKRVIIHPDYRGKGYARNVIEHIIAYGRNEQKLHAIDLHVWDQNSSAIRLYETMGFELQHRELYYRLSL